MCCETYSRTRFNSLGWVRNGTKEKCDEIDNSLEKVRDCSHQRFPTTDGPLVVDVGHGVLGFSGVRSVKRGRQIGLAGQVQALFVCSN